MEITCKELRSRAWNNLKQAGYFQSVLASFLGGILAAIVPAITTGPAMVGMARYYTVQSNEKRNELNYVVSGFSENLVNNILTYILMSIFLFLWSLLLIVPGIIKTFSYSMVPYILMDNSELTPTQAIDRSRQLMNGYKWKLFKLQLSFIGWFLLGAILCGVGDIFVLPYYQAAMAEFYQELLRCNDRPQIENA
ncbi:MAG TPA: DUF975 family protein [Clostridia bacterium]|nr:DUF975 family protein [Clostridia bacterium]